MLRGQNQISHPPADAGATSGQQSCQAQPRDSSSATLGPQHMTTCGPFVGTQIHNPQERTSMPCAAQRWPWLCIW